MSQKKHIQKLSNFDKIFKYSPLGNEIFNEEFKLEKINKTALGMYGINHKKDLNSWNLFKEIKLSNEEISQLEKGLKVCRRQSLDFDDIIEKYNVKTNRTGKVYFDITILKLYFLEKKKYIYYLMVEDLTYIIKNLQTISHERASSEKHLEDKIAYVSHLSHEIRTPLSTIIGITDILMDKIESGENQKYIELISKANEHLLTVINDILDYSKIESEKFLIEKIPFNLRKLCEDVLDLFTHSIKNKKLELILKYDHSIPEIIYGDAFRIRQILFNLIGNSVKFTEKGKICLEVINEYQNNNSVELLFRISDTGNGIEKEKLEKIFEPYSQEDIGTYKKYGGTGLGLTIVKKLIQKMEGNIEVSSRKNYGTEFEIKIKFDLISVNKQNQHIVSEEDFSNYRFLIIDDAPEMIFLFNTFISSFGGYVESTTSGIEGIKKVKYGKYDVIIMDITMPEINGYEVFRKIEQIRKENNSDMKIIAATAKDSTEDIEKMRKTGFDGIILKPVRKKTFIQEINKILRGN